MRIRGKLILSVLLVIVIVEIIVLIQRATFPYWPEDFVAMGESEAYVTSVLAPFSPILLVALLYVRPLAVATRWVASRSRTVRLFVSPFAVPIILFVRALGSMDPYRLGGSVRVLTHPRWLLVISIVSSIVLGFFPYRADLNPTGSLVGVDSPLYVEWFSNMEARGTSEAVRHAFTDAALGSRPLFLIPVSIIGQILGGSPEDLVRAMPMVLGPLLVVCTFLFVRVGLNNGTVAGLAALFTAFSFSFTVGLWAGYYANWLALAEVYLFLAVLIRFHERSSFPGLVGLMVLSLVVLFTHPWTWVLVSAVALLFCFSIVREEPRTRWNWSIALVITIGIGADVLKNLMFTSRTIVEDLATKAPVLGFHELVVFWPNIVDSLLYTHGRLLANSVFLALAIVAMVILRYQDRFQRLLIIWIVTAGVSLAFFGSYHQARLVYDLPLPVLMSFGLVALASAPGEHRLVWPGLVVVILVLYVASYALGSLVFL